MNYIKEPREALQQLLKQWTTAADKALVDAWVQTKLAPLPQQTRPHLIHLAGIPGSGKSTYSQLLLQENKQAICLSFDEIMVNLPNYQEVNDPQDKFMQFEAPAKAIGYGLLAEAINRRISIIFDHSAAHPNHLELLTLLKETGGYLLSLHYVPIELDAAIERCRQREGNSGRHVPETLIRTRFKVLETLLPEYKKLVHNFLIINPQS